MKIEEIKRKTNSDSEDMNYWLNLEKETNEFIESKPSDEVLNRLYTETQYEKVKMICSWYRHNKK